MTQVKEICNSAPSITINHDYRYFVVNKMTGKIVSGWEYWDDAIDSVEEFNEGWEYNPAPLYKICSAGQCPMYPYDSANWSNS